MQSHSLRFAEHPTLVDVMQVRGARRKVRTELEKLLVARVYGFIREGQAAKTVLRVPDPAEESPRFAVL